MANLYERTDIYDLLEDEDRYNGVKKHWEAVLDGKEIRTFYDVSIGTGNLTLPLLDLGVKVYGSDLSGEMLDACGKRAAARGREIGLRQCDFRRLTEKPAVQREAERRDENTSVPFPEKFDCVASTGNSLPYVTNEEVIQVLAQMDALVAPGGSLYYDMRNWDKILRDRRRFYLYNPVFRDDTRINLMQVWDYHTDDSMTFHLLYTFEKENRIFGKEQFEEHYFPVRRELLLDKIKEMGYRDIRLLCHPAYVTDMDAGEADWYCVIAGKKQGSCA